MEYFYYHNCLYDYVWKENARRYNEHISTWDVLNTYPSDYKVIFVGDAEMSPYEVTYPGGSVEYWNEESGASWMRKFVNNYERLIWLNPVPEDHWDYSASIDLSRSLIDYNMYPLTLKGLEDGMSFLTK